MSEIAVWLGYGLMIIGGVASLCVLAWCVTEFLWQQVLRAQGINNIFKAFHDAQAAKVTQASHSTRRNSNE